MKKKTIANTIMVAIIAVIIAAGVLTVGHIQGWFDKADAGTAVLSDIQGVVRLQRDGVSYTVEKDIVLRAGDRLTCENGGSAVIQIDGGWITIGEKAELAVLAPEADGFSVQLDAGEIFANCTTAAEVSFGSKQVRVADAAAHFSIRTGTQSISVFAGSAAGAEAGQMVEYIGDEVSVRGLQISALNSFTIGQLRKANEDAAMYFTDEQLDKLESDRKDALQNIIDSQTPTVQPTDPTEEVTQPHIHSYTANVIAPTCEAGGYTEHSCACGDTYADSQTAATGHSWTQWSMTKEPTSREEGLRERRCRSCGAGEQETIGKVAEGHVHSYTEKVVAPTCTTDGYTLYSCSCGVSYTENEIPAQGHSYVSTVTAPTCTAQGYTRHSCACGASYTDSYTDPTGHGWGEWKTVKEPTTEAEGTQERSCKNCGATEQKSIAKLEPTVAGYVYITIRCDTILDNMDKLDPAKAEFVPENGEILPMVQVFFYEGDTVFDVLVRICDTLDIQLEYSMSVYGSYYIEGINNLYEKDCGSESGWMYRVNDWFPNYGCSVLEVSDGDVIEWLYTCHGYGTDVGAPEWEG